MRSNTNGRSGAEKIARSVLDEWRVLILLSTKPPFRTLPNLRVQLGWCAPVHETVLFVDAGSALANVRAKRGC
jgi:hypothetical protein